MEETFDKSSSDESNLEESLDGGSQERQAKEVKQI